MWPSNLSSKFKHFRSERRAGPNLRTWPTIPGKAGCIGSLTGTPNSPRNPWTCHRPGSLNRIAVFIKWVITYQKPQVKGEHRLSSKCHPPAGKITWRHLPSWHQDSSISFCGFYTFSLHPVKETFQPRAFLVDEIGIGRHHFVNWKTNIIEQNQHSSVIFIKLWHPIIQEGGREPSRLTKF